MALKDVLQVAGSGVTVIVGIDQVFDAVATGTGEVLFTLYDLQIAAGTFYSDGDSIEFEFAGTFADGSATQFFIDIGGDHVLTFTAGSSVTGKGWVCRGRALRTDVDELKVYASMVGVGFLESQYGVVTSFDTTVPTRMSLIGTQDMSSAACITLETGTVTFWAVRP